MKEILGTVLYSKNAYSKVKMASTTKIMTATIVIENTNLNNIVTISKKAGGTGGSRLGLKENDTVSVNDLLYGLMLCSGNDAAVALAEYVGGSIEGFSNIMNQKAKELQLNNTHFETPHGLDSDNHYTTAYELAVLSNYAMKNSIFSKIVNTQRTTIYINNTPKDIKNTNELLGNLNGVYGIKTGFTNGANRCLVTACKRDNLDIICVVLGADTKKFRTADSVKLIEYTFANYQMVNLSEKASSFFNEWKNKNLNNFSVYKISEYSKPFDIYLCDESENCYFPINKANISNLKIEIECEYFFNSPLLSNTQIGKLYIYENSQDIPIYTRNILLSNDISRKNFLEYFLQLLKSLGNFFVS